MNKKKKDFFQELRDRNVWREIKAYFLGGATMIPLIWLITSIVFYPNDEEIVRMITAICTVIFALFLPSVFLFAYHHGESREAPWSKQEKIWIPINIIFTIFLVAMFWNNNAIASETTSFEIEDEFGNISTVDIVKPEYRKRLKICYFENQSEDTTLNWMQQGIMEACDIDLDQESYITNNPFWWYRFREKYKYGETVRFKSYLDEAKRTNTQYLLQGSFTKEKEIYSISSNLINVETAKSISKRIFKGDNFFSLIDSISHHVRITLLPVEHVEKTIDLPISSQLTKFLLAYKYYTLASEVNEEEEEDKKLQNKKTLHLYNKAIQLDPRFAQAYRSCIWIYDSQNKIDSVDLYWRKVIDNVENYPEKSQYAIKYGYLKYTKKYDAASQLLKNWATLYPEELDPHSYLAWHYDEKEMYQEAINEYEKCISLDSLNADYYKSIAYIYQYDLKDEKEGIKWKRKYANISGDKSSAYTSIASYYSNIREIDSVKYYYNKALLIKPAALSINRSLLSIDMLDITDYNTRKNKWLQLMQYAKNERDSLSIMSNIKVFFQEHGQYNKAKVLGDSIQAVKDEKSVRNWNAEIKKIMKSIKGFNDLLAKGKHKEALDVVEKISNFNDSINPAYSNKKKINKPLKEQSDWTKGIVKMFFNHSVYAFCLDENTQKENAQVLKDYLHFLENEKEEKGNWRIYDDVRESLIKAKLLAFENNYTEAIKLLEKHKTNSSKDDYLIQLARYYQKIENYKKAEEIFSLVINNPKDILDTYNRAITNYYAALLYHQWGKQEKAEEYLNISLEIWKNADADYIFSNMAKATSQEWKVEILN